MPTPEPAVRIKGLAEFQRALRQADRDARLGTRRDLREVAKPVAVTAESLATAKIRRIGSPSKWWQMRVGVTQKVVYVAPKQKGVKRKGDAERRRPKFGTLLMNRAMEPALEREAPHIEHAVEEALDHVANRFNRG